MVSSAIVALLLTAAPASAPKRPWADQVLRDQCLVAAADPGNAWALAHGIIALGPTYLASDGRRATEVIVHDYLERNTLPKGTPGSQVPWFWPRFTPDGTPVEPHSNLEVKTMVLAGVPLTTRFTTRWGEHLTLAQLVDSVKAGFQHRPDSEDYWRDAGWTLDLIGHTSQPGDVLTQADGTKISVDQVMDDGLTYLEKANAEIEAGMKKGLPEVLKRKQGIYAHTCGGLHLEQGVLTWARFPSVRKRWGKRLDAQIAVLYYRLDSERMQYEAALQEAIRAAPQYKLQMLVQMLKFYGHWLETTGRLKQELRLEPTPTQRQTMARARALLDSALRQLEAMKAFQSMDQIHKEHPQLYLDLIGDSCHAAHGWDLWQ